MELDTIMEVNLDTVENESKKKISAILSTIKNEYDIVFLDCPPGISVLHDAVFAGVDWILMPNIPTTLSIRSFESVLNYFKENDLDTSKLKCFLKIHKLYCRWQCCLPNMKINM